ncbi:MAG TPA: cytochrome c biogenesis protein [Candidatus Nanoarchaeia archaeon]|nr:cytochrome c biogenesis protein [Candidatus Nanoarchaeia archaeon]
MKYISIIIFILLFFAFGCIESSVYKEVMLSDLLSNPDEFQQKQVCISGVIENNRISGIQIDRSENYTGTYQKDGVLAKICGVYQNNIIEADSIDPFLIITTTQDVYYSNETIKVHVEYSSLKDMEALIEVSGIENAFGQPFIGETKKTKINKGINVFDFEFKTPTCGECSALDPGEYFINATIDIGSNTFESYKKITLESDDNVTGNNVTDNNVLINNSYITNTNSGNAIMVEYFYDPACQKCAKVYPTIDKILKTNSEGVTFLKYNVKTDEGLELARKYKIPGIPSIVINEKKQIAYDDYGGDVAELETLLNEALANPDQENGEVHDKMVLSIPSVFVVGFLAGFNPCLLAILAFIASVTLATTGKRRNVMLIVVMFSLGIFVTYLIVGIGLLRIIDQSASLQSTITNIIIALITLLGLWHIYDAYHLKKNTESSFYTPKAFIRLTENITKNVSLPAAFLMGALFSLIKAPCVGAVYFVILDMVRSGDGTGMLYLASYNLGVVLPVLIIGAAIAFGLNPEKVEEFRKNRRSAMRLFTGITLIAIAVLMYMEII